MKIYRKLQQRSSEWFAARRGKVTGSELCRALGGDKGKETYLYELLAERLSPNAMPLDEDARCRGTRLEPEARLAFEKATGKKVSEVGFIEADEYRGASPDGFIGKTYTESLEIKCPLGANYIRAILADEVPKEYIAQIAQAFIVNPKLKKMYFILYNPDVLIHPLHVIEVTRKGFVKKIDEIEKAENAFIRELKELEADFLLKYKK